MIALTEAPYNPQAQVRPVRLYSRKINPKMEKCRNQCLVSVTRHRSYLGADITTRCARTRVSATSHLPSSWPGSGSKTQRRGRQRVTYESFMSLRLAEQAKFATIGRSLFMDFCPLVISLAAWRKLTPQQQNAFEEAAAIADAYFDATERTDGRMERTLRRSGMAIWRMSHDEYLDWLQLAQQTAWVQYATINPRAKELLLATVRTVLIGRSDKDTLIDSIFGEGKKN